ncbi:DIS3-like exonuclease 2 [Uloborus diversus]|uniref:DIS3-like exonuclease 2 n=1 Tax=Uloborus diversus TaxID=327109 RepID=UPI00240A57B6|nr:DIS3-like exonuclease 2 [Uloborus diversus]
MNSQNISLENDVQASADNSSRSQKLTGVKCRIPKQSSTESSSVKPKGRKMKSKKDLKLIETSEQHPPGSPRAWDHLKKDTVCESEIGRDLLSKLNSSDNMRKPCKQNRRASVPSEPLDVRNSASTSKNSYSPSPGFQQSGKKNPSKYRSKTPDCKTPSTTSTKRNISQRKGIKFEPYIPLFQVQQGLKRGEFIEGALRINPRNYEDAYVSAPDGKMDIYIGGMQNRNRALNGDVVVVQINPKQEWRVLCDAIKDYQEKSGESFSETIYKPLTPSTPCQVHTPEKFFRSRPVSSNSWDSNCHERMSDTVEILGIDRLANEFRGISIKEKSPPKHKNKQKNKQGKNVKKTENQKSSTTSFSQESSDDYLDKTSPASSFEQQNSVQAVPIKNDSQATRENSTNQISHVYPPCDMSEIGTFHLEENSDLQVRDSWNSNETSVNIIVSPEELLNIEGDSILCTEEPATDYIMNDDSCSDIEGIAVAPEDLSGDEFTDSASIDSSESLNLAQKLEDAAFLACQQDAENNNMDVTVEQNLNQFNSLSEIVSVSNALISKEFPTECRLQQNIIVPSLSSVDINNESVVCSAVSEISFGKDHKSSSDENLVSNPVPLNDHVSSSIITDETKKHKLTSKGKRHRKRKRKSKPGEAVLPATNGATESENIIYDIEHITVEDVMKHPEWPKFVQKTGKVVHILHPTHSRKAAGHLKLCPDKNPKWALFSPNDSRVPRIMVPMSDCPQNFYHRPFDYADVLFLSEITEWNETSTFASGRLIKSLGNSGDIEAETTGVLIENGVDIDDFPISVMNCLPGPTWEIPSSEFQKRRDLRNQCIFTIDPASARDMDDAVSCNKLDNGNYEVGVHIADVSFFVKEDSELDQVARKRSTSVYLVQKVVPMLPRVLCDDLCSLSPGKDRLTFSVIWEMNTSGEVINQWIGRTVINSCIKLSYEHAQDMIENPNRVWNSSEHPELFGEFTIQDVMTRVNELHLLASKLREDRFLNGALRLDKPQLSFTLNSETGLPSGFNVYIQKDSNKLIEEFMLLANMSIAAQIYKSFPAVALLRRHPPPEIKPMQDIVAMCESLGIVIDSSTSGSLQNSIHRYTGNDFAAQARFLTLTNLIAKPMNCALYFCTGVLEEPRLFHHYALNVPLYTHFTSPIRRYPDVIVHRLLAAALKFDAHPNLCPQEVQKWASHCNDKKLNAKKVSEASGELFLAAFIRDIGSVEAKGMVMGVMDHSFDCLILEMGLIKRVYCDKLPLVRKDFKRAQGVSTLNLYWKDDSKESVRQTIVMLTLVDVILTVAKDSLQIKVTLQKPIKV